eukprot:5720315-Alexandrium_andersonii.AAC.1
MAINWHHQLHGGLPMTSQGRSARSRSLQRWRPRALQEVVNDSGLVSLEIESRAAPKGRIPPAQATALELPRGA